MQPTLLKKLFWIVGGALFAAGVYGWYDRFVYGHLHANYGTIVPWGLWVAAYIYFIGLSAGSFLISSLVYVFNVKRFEHVGRLAVFTAVVTLLLALLSIWADLGHMFRAWHVLAYPNFQSPMAWMIWLYSTYFLLLVVELWFLLRADMAANAGQPGLRGRLYGLLTLGLRDTSETARRRDRTVVRVLATIGVPVAIMFHGGVGALFGVIAARPGWHSGLFPILFLLSALVSGGALLAMVAAVFQSGLQQNRSVVVLLGRVVLGLLLLDVLFQVSELLVAFYGNIPGDIANLQLMISGPFWWVFWGWQVLVGTLIPILILVLPTRTDPRWVAFAGLLIAFGFLSVRLNIVIPSLAVDEVIGVSRAFASPRMTTAYVPSLSEWLLTFGVVGLGMLGFGFGEWLLPKGSDDLTSDEQVTAPVVVPEASYVH